MKNQTRSVKINSEIAHLGLGRGPRIQSNRCLMVILLLSSFPGCWSDPILDRAEELEKTSTTTEQSGGNGPEASGSVASDPSSGTSPNTHDGPVKPGSAEEPSVVQPEEPAPGIPDEPAPGSADAGVMPPNGPSVTLRGFVQVQGVESWNGQSIRLDVFDGDQQDLTAQRPSVVAMATVERPGPFEIEVSQDVGRVWIGGFADLDGDGRPSKDDPVGWVEGNPVSTSDSVEGLVLKLESRPPPPGAEME